MDRHDKVQKDRKILRRIDHNLALQSRFFILANIVIFLIVASFGGLFSTHQHLIAGWGCVLMLVSVVNFFLSVRFESYYGAGPGRWRQRFLALQLANSICMGFFCAAVILLENLSINAFLISLYMVGYSAISNVEWSPYSRWNSVRLGCNLLPAVAAYSVVGDVNGLTIAVGVFIILVMLLRQSRLLCVRHWDNVRAHHQLHNKARDLAHAVSEANTASQFKTDFLSNITHEIRTPMNNVLGMLALLDDTDLSAQQRELQNLAVQSGEGLLSLIDDIVDFSRISSGHVQLDSSVFHLKRCIDQVIELLGPRAHEKGMELSCMYDENLPVRVRGDQGRLAQLLNNLVSNAIRYSDGSDILVHVSMNKIEERLAEFRISVLDNGRGVDPSLQDHLFDAFSNKSNSGGALAGGTGLGLAISKGLAECMDGAIGFNDGRAGGTEFWFTVTLALSTQQAQKLPLIKGLINRRVLVVGAEGGVLDSLLYLLSTWDMQVESAPLKDETLKYIETEAQSEQPFELIFLNMSVLQPLDLKLVLSIRNSKALSPAPAMIILSSLAQRADALRGNIADRLDVEWLSKPVTQEKMCRALIDSFGLDQPEEAQDRLDPAARDTVGRRVLLVEDNAVSQLVAKGMLNKLGYVVTAVVNGKEALGLLEEKSFDLVLMDCMMPVLDGYETTLAWREQEREATDGRIPIVAMTASVVEGEQQKCLACGMDDYLSKPVKIEDLDAKMRSWLGAKGTHNPLSESTRKTA